MSGVYLPLLPVEGHPGLHGGQLLLAAHLPPHLLPGQLDLDLPVLVDAVLGNLAGVPGLPDGLGEGGPGLGELEGEEDVGVAVVAELALAEVVPPGHHGRGDLLPAAAGAAVGEGEHEGLVLPVLLGADAVAGVGLLLLHLDLGEEGHQPAGVRQVGLHHRLPVLVGGLAGDGEDPALLPGGRGDHQLALEAPLLHLVHPARQLLLLLHKLLVLSLHRVDDCLKLHHLVSHLIDDSKELRDGASVEFHLLSEILDHLAAPGSDHTMELLQFVLFFGLIGILQKLLDFLLS